MPYSSGVEVPELTLSTSLESTLSFYRFIDIRQYIYIIHYFGDKFFIFFNGKYKVEPISSNGFIDRKSIGFFEYLLRILFFVVFEFL